MKKQAQKTEDKIRDEIKRLEEQIASDKIRIGTLQSLIPQEENKNKPKDFVLTKAIMKVLETHRGQPISANDIFAEIVRSWNGYQPNRKSLQITLSVWMKGGKVKKDESRDGYMLG